MYCYNCGKEIEDGLNFCPFCGKDLRSLNVKKIQPKTHEENEKKEADGDMFIKIFFCVCFILVLVVLALAGY